MGVELYQLYGRQIPKAGFISTLRRYANQLDRKPKPSDAGQYRNPEWPYEATSTVQELSYLGVE
ncbi:MAG: hypothetical protein GWN00_29785 [Aliifodinibius sp.]|nr:hypothetical protein [Fodinibius sp.]NIY28830.1 hypothetical protein [Fodinibius sp.]